MARPAALSGSRQLYAIYVSGSSMAPMHGHGELRFVDPARPARPGDTVVVQTRPSSETGGETLLKIFVGRKDDKTVLRQLNPEATVEIPNRHVVSVHRVLTTNELFGR